MAVLAIFLTLSTSAFAGGDPLPYVPCAGNLILNGNFENGNTGFSTDYLIVNMYNPQNYIVDTNPHDYHAAWASFGDHTTGSGNMMIVNAADLPDKIVWQKTVTVSTNTIYEFSYWIALSYPDSPPLLEVSINGTVIGTYDASQIGATAKWVQVKYTWLSGSDTSAIIKFVDKRPAYHGDDYALDDIELCGPCAATKLIAGQQTEVGSVSVKIVDDNLSVTYRVDAPWCFTELHLAVGSIPQTKKGNPIPGQFPYSYYPAGGSCETSYTFPAIPVSCPAVIAAHAAVQKPIECLIGAYSVVPPPTCYQYETAWGQGNPFLGASNWGMWFDANNCVSCISQ